MKFKSLNSSENPIIRDARNNKNILAKPDRIVSAVASSNKKDYSSVAILSLMYESGFVNKDNIKESFEKAQEFVKSYEGEK